MTEYDKLNNELKKAGLIRDKENPSLGSGIDKLVNSSISSKNYVDILLKYLPLLNGNEQEMVVRGLTEKSNFKAVRPLLKILDNRENVNEYNLWAVTNALYRINDTSIVENIIKLSKDKTLGLARSPLLLYLTRIKTNEALHILIESLKDDKVRGQALEALGKFGDKSVIEIIRNTTVRKGFYEFKAKAIALKKLEAL